MSDAGKGLNGWTKWLVGVLFTIIFTAITTITNNVIANDEKSRDRDTRLQSDLSQSIKEQVVLNQEILIALAEIRVELKTKTR